MRFRPCARVHAPRESRGAALPAVPAGRPASAASGCLRAVRITHGWMDRCLSAVVGAGDGAPCPRRPATRQNLAAVSPGRSTRGGVRKGAKEGIAFASRRPGRPATTSTFNRDSARCRQRCAPSVFYVTGPPRMPPESSLRHCVRITIAT